MGTPLYRVADAVMDARSRRTSTQLMLPDRDYLPSITDKSLTCVFVSLDVSLELSFPIVFVGFGKLAPTLWAPMPETTVDEDRDLDRRKDSIRFSRDIGDVLLPTA